VGTWRVTGMSHNGQDMPGFDEMEMTLTFTEDGSITMSVSGGQMPEAMTQEGTYRLSDSQITMSLDNQSKTGTCTFDGHNRVTLEFDEARMVLTRT